MALFDDHYLEKTGVLQESLYQSEKRRLELERELFTYHTSEKHSARVNNAKLCGYLKNICEREKQAKKRNLQLLKDAEYVQLCVGASPLDHSTLHQKQVECWNKMTRLSALRKSEKASSAESVSKGNVVLRPPPDTSSIHYMKDLFQPAAVFMGCQTSAGSIAEPLAFSTQLSQPPGPLPRQMPSSSEPWGHDVVSLSRFLRQDAYARPGSSSFVLTGSDSTTRQGASEKNESAAPLVLTNPVPHQSIEAFIPHVSSKVSQDKEEPQSMAKHQEALDVNDPVKVSSISEINKENSRSIPQILSHQNGFEKLDEYTESASGASSPGVITGNAADASSELPLSHTEDKGPAVYPGGRTPESPIPPVTSEREMCDTPSITAHVGTGTKKAGSQGTEALQGCSEGFWQDAAQLETSAEQLSLKGFFHLLNSIEGRLNQRENKLYKISSVSKEKLNSLISLCNGEAALNGEDLEACGAVVLHQFQRLSWSMSKGCLLRRDIVSAHWMAADGRRIRSHLPPDGALLWDRWLQHVLLLESSGVLTASEVVDLFTPLLVQTDATYVEEAKVLVKRLLPQTPEASLSLRGEQSPNDLPSLFNDSEEVSLVEPADLLSSTDTRKQELQSAEEDSAEEGFVKSIPIRETKAYQLLKQSATQQRRLSSEEHDDGSDLDLSGERCMNSAGKDVLTKTSPTPHQEVHQFRAERMVPAVKSKAFWGESDDSGSDIEAALRPASRHDDDFDFSD
ncbi:centrosomal protein kizuna isoform X1 [Scleropages formosus]|uniref:Centrosomal protein kizuna n=2 Tax=Scleropages formosus TaxID=113540 RepID=A0A8C9RIV1_SCLFO|nr:centrosomal protein kizuna isoform X1 [Scleropages formosus]